MSKLKIGALFRRVVTKDFPMWWSGRILSWIGGLMRGLW